MLPSEAVSALPKSRGLRVAAVVATLSMIVSHLFAGAASGEQSLEEMRERLSSIQTDLDASTEKVEEARARLEQLLSDIAAKRKELGELRAQNNRLRSAAIDRAATLYMEGSTGMVEVLLTADNLSDLADDAEILSRVSAGDNDVFVELARSEHQIRLKVRELAADRKALVETESRLKEESDKLQAQFDSLSADVKKAMEKLGVPASSVASMRGSGGMYCPVAGPTSFVDSWGAPRSGGRSHQGVDMMGARGTPQVAVTSGTITHASYSSLGGNVQYLSGDDGNLYVYIHQQSHAVTSGRVKAGQVISYLGDTGNARGMPHLHFELHPGGGAAVNPYPFVASLCR